MTGSTWIEESGSLAQPILITNTHAVGARARGAPCAGWSNTTREQRRRGSLPVVAETWDGYLNHINGGHVTAGPRYRRARRRGALARSWRVPWAVARG